MNEPIWFVSACAELGLQLRRRGHFFHPDDGYIAVTTIGRRSLNDRLTHPVLGKHALDLFGRNRLIELDFPNRTAGKVDSEIEPFEDEAD